MDIWIIQDGEKRGPVRDFEVRRRIGSGELRADTPAWHEGLAEWRPLSEIAVFQREFDGPGETFQSIREPAGHVEPAAKPPLLPDRPVLFRRFWARWFDIYLFIGVWWILMWAAGRDIEATLKNPWVILFQYVPWFVLETILIHRFGSTPGKALLGLKVTNSDGSLLSLKQASSRSILVLVIGIGFGWGILPLIFQLLSFFTARWIGKPLWDYAGGHRVKSVPMHSFRVFAFVCLFFCTLNLQMIVISPYVTKQAGELFPELKEEFEKNPPWHLPERNGKNGMN